MNHKKMAPPVGFEPTTQRLTAACSATELQGNTVKKLYSLNTKFARVNNLFLDIF